MDPSQSKLYCPITFTLQLPEQWHIHPMFHASELLSYQETDIHGPNLQEPPPDIITGEEYEVEAILAHKGTGKRKTISYRGLDILWPATDGSQKRTQVMCQTY
jgi:hypothetical protein